MIRNEGENQPVKQDSEAFKTRLLRVLAVLRKSLIDFNRINRFYPNHFFDLFRDSVGDFGKALDNIAFQFLVTSKSGLVVYNALIGSTLEKEKELEIAKQEVKAIELDFSSFGFADEGSLYALAINSDFPILCRPLLNGQNTDESRRENEQPNIEFRFNVEVTAEDGVKQGKDGWLRIPEHMRLGTETALHAMGSLLRDPFTMYEITLPTGDQKQELHVFVHMQGISRLEGDAQTSVRFLESEADIALASLVATFLADQVSAFLRSSASVLSPESMAAALNAWRWTHVFELILARPQDSHDLLDDVTLSDSRQLVAMGAAIWSQDENSIRNIGNWLQTKKPPDAKPQVYIKAMIDERSRREVLAGPVRIPQLEDELRRADYAHKFTCFYSSRGGTGKTTLAYGIARRIADLDQDVCLLELDLTEPSLASLCDIPSNGRDSVPALIKDLMFDPKSVTPENIHKRIDVILHRDPESKLAILAAPPNPSEELAPALNYGTAIGMAIHALSSVYKCLDERGYHVIIDAPAGVDGLAVPAIVSLPKAGKVAYVTTTYKPSIDSFFNDVMWKFFEEDIRESGLPDVHLILNKVRPFDTIWFQTRATCNKWFQEKHDRSLPDFIRDVMIVPWAEELEVGSSDAVDSGGQWTKDALLRILWSLVVSG